MRKGRVYIPSLRLGVLLLIGTILPITVITEIVRGRDANLREFDSPNPDIAFSVQPGEEIISAWWTKKTLQYLVRTNDNGKTIVRLVERLPFGTYRYIATFHPSPP